MLKSPAKKMHRSRRLYLFTPSSTRTRKRWSLRPASMSIPRWRLPSILRGSSSSKASVRNDCVFSAELLALRHRKKKLPPDVKKNIKPTDPSPRDETIFYRLHYFLAHLRNKFRTRKLPRRNCLWAKSRV